MLSLSGSAGVDQTGNYSYASFRPQTKANCLSYRKELFISQIAYSGEELIGTTAGNGNVVRIDQRGEYQVSLKYFQQDNGIQLAIQQGSWLSGRVDVTQNGDKNCCWLIRVAQ